MLTTLICLALFAAVLAVSVRLMENSLIYFPSKHPAGRWNAQGYGLAAEDVWLATSDGVRIHGWYVTASVAPGGAGGLAAGDSGVPVILFFHGNGGNLTDRIEKLQLLTSLSADVFIIDYRGYGRSEGKPNEPGIYMDGDAAYKHLTAGRGVAAERVIVFGESLGGAVACEIAARYPTGGVILESTFTSASEMARKVLPLLSPRLYLKTRFDNLGKISRITTPVLLIHGTQDTTVPPEHSQRLYDAASEPKALALIPGAGHNDVFVVGGGEYAGAILRFLASCTAGQVKQGSAG